MEHLGRMNDPTACSSVKGPCGEEMEFYLAIEDGVITGIKFYAEGCEGTLDCGETTAAMAEGKEIIEALAVSPKIVMDRVKGLSPEHKHCAILAVSTLYRAIAEYMLRP